MAKTEFDIEKLKGVENYHTWSFAMENYLALSQLNDCITTKDDEVIEKDKSKLTQAKAKLVLSVDKSVYVHMCCCSGKNHKNSECKFKKNTNQSSRKSDDRKQNESVKHAFPAMSHEHDSSMWLIDSGASTHMTSDGNILCNKKNHFINDIVIAGNSRMKVNSIGNTEVKIGKNDLTIHNVLHVPKLSTNLLSVSKIVNQGNKVVFSKEDCTIYGSNGVEIVNTIETDGIYKLNVSNISCLLTTNSKSETITTWH